MRGWLEFAKIEETLAQYSSDNRRSSTMVERLKERYQPKEIEEKWQRNWAAAGLYKVTEDTAKPKYYCLEMFPLSFRETAHEHVRTTQLAT